MYRILVIAIVLILYGSLWPWQYNPAHATGNPLWVLLHSWPNQRGALDMADIVVNLLLYIPVGMFGYMALDKGEHRRLRVIGPVALGFVLSVSVEMTQIFDKTRNCSAVDLLCNTVSAAAGVLLGFFFRASLRSSSRRPMEERRFHASGPLMLVYLWVGFQTIPIFPLTFKIAAKVHALSPTHLSRVEFLVSLIAWLAIARLLEAVYDPKWAWRVLLSLSLLAPAKIFIEQRQPTYSELAGVASALIIWKLILCRLEWRTAIVAGMMILLLAVQGLHPFQFTGRGHFSWIPFLSLLQSQWEHGLVLLCEKGFWYGASVWLLWASGQRLIISSVLIASLLAAIEAAQIYLPGRTAEITDPLLAMILGCIVWVFQHHGPRAATRLREPEPVPERA
ncbi:MAG: VanZ family protein [Bryobacteraceae bacterium]